MAVRRVDLGVAHIAAVVQQGLDDFAAAGGGKAPVGGEAHEQKFCAGPRQRGAQVAAKFAGRVKVVQRAGDEQIGVGVKVFGELVTLVAQVALNLKLHILRGVLITNDGLCVCASRSS